MLLADSPLALLMPRRARHRNRLMSGGGRPRPYHTEVRPGVLRDFCYKLPSQSNMCNGIIELSCAPPFAATVASSNGMAGARRHCADCLSAEQPHCQACTFNAQGGTGNAEPPLRRGRLFQHWPAQRLQVRLHVLGLDGDGQVCDAPRFFPGLRAFTLGSRNAPAIFMYQVYGALRGLTDECVSVYLGGVLLYSLTTAARRTHLWMVLDWLLEYQLRVCASVCDFWSVRCHYKCGLDLDCGFRSLPPVAPGSPRTTRSFMYKRR